MNPRILLTGAAGRLGSAIHRQLRQDYELIGLDSRSAENVQYICDLRDPKRVRDALRGAQVVIHTAALHAPHVGERSEDEFRAINVDATVQLAELAGEAGVQHFIFTSSTAIYGSANQHPERAVWVDEHSEVRPSSIYHRTKWMAEHALEALCERSSLECTILRIARCFPEPLPMMCSYRLHRGIDELDVASAHLAALRTPFLDKSRGSGTVDKSRGSGTVDKSRGSGTADKLRRYVISYTTPFCNEPDELVALKTDAPSVIRLRTPALADYFQEQGWELPRSIDRVYDNTLARRELAWQPDLGWESLVRGA